VTSRLKPQPESSTQEVLAGLVERVTYHNAENGFCVLRITARPSRISVGHAATIRLNNRPIKNGRSHPSWSTPTIR
jgi:hypothetical protein